jgi:hypothetical protein
VQLTKGRPRKGEVKKNLTTFFVSWPPWISSLLLGEFNTSKFKKNI